MRPIKFRAWDKEKGEMISWKELSTTYASFLNTPNDWLHEAMQFTGLLDKNGKEIYEGDIVKAMLEVPITPTKVWWMPNSAQFGLYGWTRNIDEFEEIEVIGNIYENKELLK